MSDVLSTILSPSNELRLLVLLGMTIAASITMVLRALYRIRRLRDASDKEALEGATAG